MRVRILLFGGRGMVGRNFLEHPGAANWEVLAPPSSELNLLDFAAVSGYVRRSQPVMVIHAAGRVGGIQANIREPARFLSENLDMGRNVVLAARDAGVKRLINLGSSCMYPRDAPNPLHEGMILQGALEPTNEGYALAKIATAKLCEYISRESPELAYKTLIPCNVYGKYDSFDPARSHLVASVIKKVHDAKTTGGDVVEIWGDGTARREFVYAGDLADCLVRAVERFETVPETMNVGAGDDHAVDEYYSVAAEVLGWRGRFVHDLAKPVGMKRKLVSVERQLAWGWSPKTDLREGIARTYEYYRGRGT
jgi:GDP-L-fucose synthase